MSCVRGQPVPGYSAGCAPQEGQKQGLVGLDIQVQTPDARDFFFKSFNVMRIRLHLRSNTGEMVSTIENFYFYLGWKYLLFFDDSPYQVSCVKSKHRSKPLCMWGIYSSPSLLILRFSTLDMLSQPSVEPAWLVTSMTKYLTLINLIRVCTSGTIASAGTRRT